MDGNQNYTNPQETAEQAQFYGQPATKFCKYCGATLLANAMICGACGRQQDTPVPYNAQKYNGLGIAGFILSILGFSVISLVFSIIGLSQIKKNGDKGKGFAVAGLIISILGILAFLAVVAIYIIAVIGFASSYGGYYGGYYGW